MGKIYTSLPIDLTFYQFQDRNKKSKNYGWYLPGDTPGSKRFLGSDHVWNFKGVDQGDRFRFAHEGDVILRACRFKGDKHLNLLNTVDIFLPNESNMAIGNYHIYVCEQKNESGEKYWYKLDYTCWFEEKKNLNLATDLKALEDKKEGKTGDVVIRWQDNSIDKYLWVMGNEKGKNGRPNDKFHYSFNNVWLDVDKKKSKLRDKELKKYVEKLKHASAAGKTQAVVVLAQKFVAEAIPSPSMGSSGAASTTKFVLDAVNNSANDPSSISAGTVQSVHEVLGCSVMLVLNIIALAKLEGNPELSKKYSQLTQQKLVANIATLMPKTAMTLVATIEVFGKIAFNHALLESLKTASPALAPLGILVGVYSTGKSLFLMDKKTKRNIKMKKSVWKAGGIDLDNKDLYEYEEQQLENFNDELARNTELVLLMEYANKKLNRRATFHLFSALSSTVGLAGTITGIVVGVASGPVGWVLIGVGVAVAGGVTGYTLIRRAGREGRHRHNVRRGYPANLTEFVTRWVDLSLRYFSPDYILDPSGKANTGDDKEHGMVGKFFDPGSLGALNLVSEMGFDVFEFHRSVLDFTGSEFEIYMDKKGFLFTPRQTKSIDDFRSKFKKLIQKSGAKFKNVKSYQTYLEKNKNKFAVNNNLSTATPTLPDFAHDYHTLLKSLATPILSLEMGATK